MEVEELKSCVLDFGLPQESLRKRSFSFSRSDYGAGTCWNWLPSPPPRFLRRSLADGSFREMAASENSLALDKPNSAEDCRVVLPRYGSQRIPPLKYIKLERPKQEEMWTPADTETNSERESKLMQEIQTCVKKLESSLFWLKFLDQLQTPEIFDLVLKAAGSEGKMLLVIYGIGNIELHKSSRLQLSLVILMKRMFSWIGEVEVFDPVISVAESRVLATLGFSVLTVNEQGRRKAVRPTMFFMPHCEMELYGNLLEANWRADLLNNIVLLGNSFAGYEEVWILHSPRQFTDSRKHVKAIRQFLKEVEVEPYPDDLCSRAFYSLSWHFFNVDPHSDLSLL